MTFAWDQGLPYSVFTPAGRHDIAKNTPFGGPAASASRARFAPMLLDDLADLRSTLGATLWDEASAAAPRFHRVEPTSYESLLQEAKGRTSDGAAHLAAMVFFPATFAAPFDMPVVFERRAGSAPAALRELERGKWAVAATSARDTLVAALRDATSLHLPMIVDL